MTDDLRLRDIPGKDGDMVFPQKEPMYGSVDPQGDSEAAIYNNALDDCGSLRLKCDVDKLAESLHRKMIYKPYWECLSNWDKARMAKDKKNSPPYKLAELLTDEIGGLLYLEPEPTEAQCIQQ